MQNQQDNTGRIRMLIKNSLLREMKPPVKISVMIEHLETKTSADPCTGSTPATGRYTVIKAHVNQVRLCLLFQPRLDRCSFYLFHF